MKSYSVKLLIIFILLLAGSASAFAEDMRDVTKSFKVTKGGSVDVSLNLGDVQIITWDKDEVLVQARGLYSDNEDDNLRITQNGNNIKVSYDEGWGDAGELKFIISVPGSFNVDVRTMSGDIAVNGSLKGELNATTSGGDIKLQDINGRVMVNTSGGDISSGNINGNASFTTSGGDITTGNINGEAEIKTMGGDLRISNVTKRLSAKTYGGDITIGNIGGNADVATYGGDINVKNVSGDAKLSTSGGDVKLEGATGTVNAKSAGGSLLLKKVSGTIIASTASGDIVAELMPAGKGESRITTAMGDITLYLPENSKATVDAAIRVRGWWKGDKENYGIKSEFKQDSYNENNEKKEIQAVYTINGGGDRIKLETVNSDIEIRKMIKQ